MVISRLQLRKIFARMGAASKEVGLHVEFSDGSVYKTNRGQTNVVGIRFRNPRAERYTLINFHEGLFESYISGSVDLEGTQPIAALAKLGHDIGSGAPTFWSRFLKNPVILLRQIAQEHRQDNSNRDQAIRNADFHYALPPALFEHMLGESVGYSEGLWTAETKTLNQAKFNNYEYICRKLRLRPGMQVLEVGSGWGYMPIYMAKRYGVNVTVYNPVRRQNDYMLARFRRHGVENAIRLVEGDHRDIMQQAGFFDRFVSIGVQEHAGYRRSQYQLWADAIAASLKVGGVGVVSTTSLMVRQMTYLLTLKYIWPGGHIPSLPDTLSAFHQAGLMMIEVENLWPHYQRTLDEWRKNFVASWPEIQKNDPSVFTEEFRRRWTMYMEGTVEIFGDSLNLSHIIFAKGREASYLPWRGADNLVDGLIGGDKEPECYP